MASSPLLLHLASAETRSLFDMAGAGLVGGPPRALDRVLPTVCSTADGAGKLHQRPDRRQVQRQATQDGAYRQSMWWSQLELGRSSAAVALLLLRQRQQHFGRPTGTGALPSIGVVEALCDVYAATAPYASRHHLLLPPASDRFPALRLQRFKTVPVRDKRVRMQIWDTAGQDRFRNITNSYYRCVRWRPPGHAAWRARARMTHDAPVSGASADD